MSTCSPQMQSHAERAHGSTNAYSAMQPCSIPCGVRSSPIVRWSAMQGASSISADPDCRLATRDGGCTGPDVDARARRRARARDGGHRQFVSDGRMVAVLRGGARLRRFSAACSRAVSPRYATWAAPTTASPKRWTKATWWDPACFWRQGIVANRRSCRHSLPRSDGDGSLRLDSDSRRRVRRPGRGPPGCTPPASPRRFTPETHAQRRGRLADGSRRQHPVLARRDSSGGRGGGGGEPLRRGPRLHGSRDQPRVWNAACAASNTAT